MYLKSAKVRGPFQWIASTDPFAPSAMKIMLSDLSKLHFAESSISTLWTDTYNNERDRNR